MLTAQELRNTLNYDPDTGIFTWRVRNSNRITIGSVAGTHTGPYLAIRINNKSVYAHRLAWLYVYGALPNGQIDHINGNKRDNRISNLRDANPSQNGINRGHQNNNKSGVKGVSWNKRDKRWCAFIKHNKKTLFLGGFSTPDDAHIAYCQAARQLFGDFAPDAKA